MGSAVRRRGAARIAGARRRILWCARWFWPGRPPAPAEVRCRARRVVASTTRRSLGRTSTRLADPDTRALDRASASSTGRSSSPTSSTTSPAASGARPVSTPSSAIRRGKCCGVIGTPTRRREPAGTDHLVRFVRESGLYPSCDRGHLNLYQPFLERALSLARPGGRVGMILPWGLSADDGAASLRARLLDRSTLDTVVGLDNADAIFPIHRGMRFVVVVAGAGGRTARSARAFWNPDERGARCAAGPRRPGDVGLPDPADAGAACARRRTDTPHFRTRDRRPTSIFSRTSPPPVRRSAVPRGGVFQFGRELNVSDDRESFGAEGLPAIEGKHVQPFVADPTTAMLHVTAEEAAATPAGPAIRAAASGVSRCFRGRQSHHADRGDRSGRGRHHAHAVLPSHGGPD